MPGKKYSIQYRYLKLDDLGAGANLQEMIVRCMRAEHAQMVVGQNARARIIDLDQDGSYVILNRITDPAHWDGKLFSGQLIHLQRGTDVAAVLQSLEEDAEEFLLEQVNLGEKSHVLKGVLYFVAVDNHVGLVEGAQVRGRTLERYLTMLFQRHEALEPGQPILLNSSFRAADGKRLAEARNLTISAEPNRGPMAQEAEKVIGQEAAKVGRDGATVFDVLRTLGWGEDALDRLKQEVPDDGWIEGFFRVLIKKRGRTAPISRATIDEALRNIDPEDMGLSGEGTEKGGMVKLSTQRTIETKGSLQDPTDAVEQIVNALKEWALSGKIDCTFE